MEKSFWIAAFLVCLCLLPDTSAAACDDSFSSFLQKFAEDDEFAATRKHRRFTGKERLIDADGRTTKTGKVKDKARIYSFGGRAYPNKAFQEQLQITTRVGLAVSKDVRVVTLTSKTTGETINYGFRMAGGCWRLWYKEFIVDA